MSKELSIFLIFLLISCFFWVLQSLQETSEVEMEIPIYYSEVPANISITNKLPKTFTIALRDKGTNLFYYYRHRNELAIHLDLMKWYRKDQISRIPSGVFETSLRNRLMPTTQLLRLTPNTVAVYFVEKAIKVVPVHLNSRISLSLQHILSDSPIIRPSKINVYAPVDVLNSINRVETELLELDDLGDSTVVTLKLKPIVGVRFSTNRVKIYLNVEEFTEKILTIPVKGLHFPPGENLLSFPSSVEVTFFVGLSSYTKITENDFEITVDRTNLMMSEKRSQKVMLTKYPTNVHNIRIKPETVDCLIEKK